MSGAPAGAVVVVVAAVGRALGAQLDRGVVSWAVVVGRVSVAVVVES